MNEIALFWTPHATVSLHLVNCNIGAWKGTQREPKRSFNIHNNLLSRVLALANIVDGRWDSFQPLLLPYKNGNESFMQGALLNHLWNALIELCDELMRGSSEVPDVVSENLRELDC